MFREKQNRRIKHLGTTSMWLSVIAGFVVASTIPTAFAESFDKPIRKTVVNLGRSSNLMPNNPAQVELTCFYYSAFVVKQLNDPGMKGTREVTIESALKGHTPECRTSSSATGGLIYNDGWFFVGAKDSLLFFEASDGDENQGMPFRIIDRKTGKKIFEDSARWDGHLEFANTVDGKILLHYLRVARGDCSIPQEGQACWDKFKEKFGLPSVSVPKCMNYLEEQKLTDEDVRFPSIIAYPVTVELFPQPSIRAVQGAAKCNQL